MTLPLEDRIILANHKGKPVPPNIRALNSKNNCTRCLHCDDEILTLCLKYSFEVEYEEVCDDFKGCEQWLGGWSEH